MKIYKVYHNREFMSHPEEHWGAKVMPQPDKLDLVATVNVPATSRFYGLEDVYHCTNHTISSWWDNPNVLSFFPKRSTSCGDVIETDTGRRYVVAAIGFVEMI